MNVQSFEKDIFHSFDLTRRENGRYITTNGLWGDEYDSIALGIVNYPSLDVRIVSLNIS